VLNTAIIGLGWWGRHIVDSIADSKKLQIIRGVDTQSTEIKSLVNTQNFPITNNLEDALRDKNVEAVILATPHSLHEEQIIRCAHAKKHVFVEKPMTLTAEGAKKAIEACELANLTLGVGHERRFEPAFKVVQNLVTNGSLGTLMHVESNFSHDLLAKTNPEDWRASQTEAPIPALSSMGIHLTDMYLNLFGPIREVYAHHAQRHTNWGSGDTLSVQVLFDSGMTGYISSILATTMFIRFHVFGSNGWVEVRSDVHPGQKGITRLIISENTQPIRTREFDYKDTVRANLEAFAEAICNSMPYPITTEEKLGNILTMEAIIKSANSGKPISV
jgi:predicted dehydrogenase